MTIIAFGMWTGPGAIALCAAFYLMAAKMVDVLIFPPRYLGSHDTVTYLKSKSPTGFYKPSNYTRPKNSQMIMEVVEAAKHSEVDINLGELEGLKVRDVPGASLPGSHPCETEGESCTFCGPGKTGCVESQSKKTCQVGQCTELQS